MVIQVFQYTMKSTEYRMNPVLIDDMNQCNTNGYRIFLADSSVDAIVIIAIGRTVLVLTVGLKLLLIILSIVAENLVLSVTDPNWSQSSALLLFSSDTFFFWEITSVIPGEYLLSLTSQNVR